jgi:hypothetical protein
MKQPNRREVLDTEECASASALEEIKDNQKIK